MLGGPWGDEQYTARYLNVGPALTPKNSATITADAREQQAALPPAQEILFQAVRLSCGQQAHQAVVPIRKLEEQAYDR